MMKRLLILTLALAMCMGMTAYGVDSSMQTTSSEAPANESSTEDDESWAVNTSPGTKRRTLVAYFSCTGNTQAVAETIAGAIGAELYEIVPAEPYTADDLNYSDASYRATREQNDASARPEIAASDINISDYDTVFLGYPIWWGQAPRIISTFLENHDFSGKTIVPFCTSHSSGIGSSDTDLHSLCADVTWREGRRFSSDTTKEDVEEWLNGLGIIPAAIGGMLDATNDISFNFETKTVKLNSGYEMPILGLGTYSLLDDVCVNSVSVALQNGCRLIDTASIYNNEESVGQAVRESSVPREEIFITTKLYPNQFTNAEESIEAALEKLNVGYIDLILLHHPGAQDVEAYKAMENANQELNQCRR